MNNEAEEMYKFHINSHSLLHSMSPPLFLLFSRTPHSRPPLQKNTKTYDNGEKKRGKKS